MFRSQFVRKTARPATLLLLGALITSLASVSLAGHRFFRNNSVGGVSIDPTGVLRQPVVRDRAMLLKEMRLDVKPAKGELNRPVGLRMISLRGLEAAIQDALTNNLGELPDEVKYLAGLQRVQYVFLYPEQNDIVLAGPGEGWRVDEFANVVGVTTGRPVIQLDDLLVAFRTANQAGEGEGISCSINPTAEGLRRFQGYMKGLRTIRDFNGNLAAKAMGQQKISITGVATNSHFARVLVAADYRMKRYAMGLDKPPVKGLPSFLDLMKSKRGRPTSMMPRWWLACNYEPLARSEDGLAWQLRGQGVKAMTEDDFIGDDGTVKASGRKNPVAQTWADNMTAKYDELAKKDAVFGELRNLMDLCVVAALIEKHDMLNKVGLRLPLITSQDSDLGLDEWNAPKTVGTECSTMKVGREWVITASGGVQVDSWQVASKTEMNSAVEGFRTKAKARGKKEWWWNHSEG